MSPSHILSPSRILRDAAALFLCKGAHNHNEKFSFGIRSPDVFFLKVDFNPLILELADGSQTVYGIPGKTTDRFL
jgi:hypothetical protein